ncbi:CpsB/CapC family capsule biosynthesis tyrosine phosphatase [Paraglaciecola aquimarina]|uniref:protein-tyrosine-phosphatase n=1 Tax=Paraglaciecola aquimarina TaxID=1235557 RepID=A0ABU3T165_9ALTE|nr:CpsB/CapC family capsule biosynthesis tyrosine phosphatase [Paraglaciecola aquimarina]MDU0356009.1 CpsB/CapC family capsule biosynthesis tyrosine phosphatase [Paraglaciecola aquimarina]
MAEQAMECGVTHIVCTPHIHQGYFDNTQENIIEVAKTFSQYLTDAGCQLKIASAAELRICPEIMFWYKNNTLPYLGTWQGKNVILLELPHSHVPAGTDNLIRWLLNHNIQPLIAHPERNRDILADYRKFEMLKRCGCLFQLTAGSVIGRFSKPIQTLALKMLEQKAITVIASDSHNLDRRPNDMGRCRAFLQEHCDRDYVTTLVETNPKEITQTLGWL